MPYVKREADPVWRILESSVAFYGLDRHTSNLSLIRVVGSYNVIRQLDVLVRDENFNPFTPAIEYGEHLGMVGSCDTLLPLTTELMLNNIVYVLQKAANEPAQKSLDHRNHWTRWFLPRRTPTR